MAQEWRQRENERVAHLYIGALDEPGFRMRLCCRRIDVPGTLAQPRTERRCKRCQRRETTQDTDT